MERAEERWSGNGWGTMRKKQKREGRPQQKTILTEFGWGPRIVRSALGLRGQRGSRASHPRRAPSSLARDHRETKAQVGNIGRREGLGNNWPFSGRMRTGDGPGTGTETHFGWVGWSTAGEGGNRMIMEVSRKHHDGHSNTVNTLWYTQTGRTRRNEEVKIEALRSNSARRKRMWRHKKEEGSRWTTSATYWVVGKGQNTREWSEVRQYCKTDRLGGEA